MQRPVQITFKDIPHSDAVETHIREKVAKLETFYPNIIGWHVTVELPHKHHHQGKLHNVRIDIKVPGNEIVVNRDKHEDIYVALRDAFDAAKRQLDDYSRRLRRETKVHPQEYTGLVTQLVPDEGYGFIRRADGNELYFSSDNLVNTTFDQLQAGVEVKAAGSYQAFLDIKQRGDEKGLVTDATRRLAAMQR